MPTVREWLASIGMSEYAELFSTNWIDSAVLPDLTDHDLEKLGVVLGDRRKNSSSHPRIRRSERDGSAARRGGIAFA